MLLRFPRETQRRAFFALILASAASALARSSNKMIAYHARGGPVDGQPQAAL